MDLTDFTEKKKSKKKEKQILVSNSNFKISEDGEFLEIEVLRKEGFNLLDDFLFFNLTYGGVLKSEGEAEEFFRKAIDVGVEGVMIKNLESEYKPGLRSGAMAKLKETKEDLDVVILAAEHGKGKRAGFYSSFVVGVLGDGPDEFLTVGKVSSGIKELGNSGASMTRLTELLKPLKIKEKDNLVYFEPKIVLQVRYQEIQKSNKYDSGYALRFPRIIFLREDKKVEEINSIEDIERFV